MTYYLKNKIFIGTTLLLVLVIAAVMCWPMYSGLFQKDETTDPADLPVMLVASQPGEDAALIENAFRQAFPGYVVRVSDAEDEELREAVISGEAGCAFVLESDDAFTYYVNNLSMYDTNAVTAQSAMQRLYQTRALLASGMSPQDASAVMDVSIRATVTSLGKNQADNFFYTYVMIFALYMVIMLYGQMVATNVATEKSSRAMEVLITSARPTSMMFGKVLASCLAGFIQIAAVFGSALVLYHINRDYWAGNPLVQSLFNIPPELFAYMLIFFVLGFLIYAFLYGALGSTATKLEDINTSTMPLILLFVAAFIVSMMGMSSGNVDSTLMKVCSFVPFTSPMAMFTRIAMSTVPMHEILLSIAILAVSSAGIGVLAAKIYRVGVLLYGTTPKLGAILKAIRKA
ncbi:MAG: ABC transporter permease [Clostridiales bacterium]|nr:ABC transporter permease [Clostridiales bacterium]